MGMCFNPESDSLTNNMTEYTIAIRIIVKHLLVDESFKTIVKSGQELVKAVITVESISNKDFDVFYFESNDKSYLNAIEHVFQTESENMGLQAENNVLRNIILKEQNAEIAPLIARVEILKFENISELDMLMARLEKLKYK
jgi:hypothetical protein